MGKCISFSLAFPGAKFYIREMANAIGSAATAGDVRWSPGLRKEIEFWRFLDSWEGHVPWRSERHWAISISTDASMARWAGVIHLKSGDMVLGDFWEADISGENINVKEMWAVAKVLESLPPAIRDCRVDVQIDNQAVLYTWMGRGSKSKPLTKVAQRLFQLVTSRNILLELTYLPSECNPADWFSRTYSKRGDSMLSGECWKVVQRNFGGKFGHNLDLMALDSNVQRDHQGLPLRH